MTDNAARAATLVRALHASVEHDPEIVAAICTDDVTAWSPGLAASSATELAEELQRRDDAFSDVELEVSPLDVAGDFAVAEWCVAMTHTGPLVLADGIAVDATGLRIRLHGITVAEFEGDRICSLRQYWDELSVLDQLGLLADDED